MNPLAWWERTSLAVIYFVCRLRKHPEDPNHRGFCRCGDFQPNKAGVPMQHIDDWDAES